MNMTCPHCLRAISVESESAQIGLDADAFWIVRHSKCPSCNKIAITLLKGHWAMGNFVVDATRMIYPKQSNRQPIPAEVDDTDITQDYSEACLVLADSPKASAALSRRCLQHILATKGKATHHNLADAIQHLLDSTMLPSYIADSLDAVRNIGNFSAHPMKSKQSGEIVDVEPGEAEWNLDVIETLFDFYWVQPKQIEKRREALNAKLADAGKPPMKVPPK